jgi:hypothetical protein
MQAACNRTKGAHPFDFDASSMEAQAHTSCNRRAGYYVRETAPPLAPVPHLPDCETGATTRGNPAHGPTVPTEHISHGSVSRGRRRDGRYGQKWAGSNGGGRRAEAAVKSSTGSRPFLGQRESPLPRREDDAPVFRSSNGSRTHNGRLANHSSRRINSTASDRRHLWQAKQATLHLRHNDRVKKGAPRRSISYPFPLPLSLSCYRDRERGYSERDPSLRRKRASSPPTDQRFEGWPLGRVRQPPQSTRAPRPLLIRGSKAGPSEGFDSRVRALGLRAHYWSEVRRLAPRKGSTATSDHSGSTPTTDQGFIGWPSKGSTAASEHAERGMTLGTSDTWPRLGLRSRGTLVHFRDQ